MKPITLFVISLAAVRILIGLAPLVAPNRIALWLGFPREHLTPTMRLFARLFGIRDLGLGALILGALGDPALLPLALWFNAAHDLLDAGAIAIPLLRQQVIKRPARLFLAFSATGIVLFGLAGWLTLKSAA
jgi:hypothetical protein